MKTLKMVHIKNILKKKNKRKKIHITRFSQEICKRTHKGHLEASWHRARDSSSYLILVG